MRYGMLAMVPALLAGSGSSAPARASDFGCEVLLCLSNPGGPTQYGACVPPITKLWRDLAIGKGFPACSGGGVARAKISGKRGSSSYRVTMTYADGSRQVYFLTDPTLSRPPDAGSATLLQGAATR